MNRSAPRRDRRRVIAIALLAMATVSTVAVLVTWSSYLAGPPPRTLVMATGPAGATYDRLGQRYRAALAESGISLELRTTGGAVDNLALLNDASSGISVGFVHGGLTNPEQSPSLVSLGTVSLEPVWIFHRTQEAAPPRIEAIWGKTLSIGPPGSGANAIGRRLVAALELDQHEVRVLELPHADGAEALARGEIDILLIVAPWEDAVVQGLMQDASITVSQFRRADAIVARASYLSKVTVPEGVADLADNLPPTDLTLIATQGSLVVREDVHPALQYLLLDAASRIHAAPAVIGREYRYPAADTIDLPLSQQAMQYYKSGRPFLQRYLPFTWAVQTQRLLFLLIPVLGILYPLLRLLPGVYEWIMRHRVYHLYRELKHIERELNRRDPTVRYRDIEEKLLALEQHAQRMRLPSAFANHLYLFRMHVGLVRQDLEGRPVVDG